jgi:hypothetical protein
MHTEIIYMYLPDEAVDVWRPVQAEKLGPTFTVSSALSRRMRSGSSRLPLSSGCK